VCASEEEREERRRSKTFRVRKKEKEE